MPSDVSAVSASQLRWARAAVAACFFTNAALYATLVPRLPQVKDQLGLSTSSLGAALAALPLGAALAGLSSAALIRRFSSARVASLGLALLAVALWMVTIAPNWPVLAAVLLVAGALDAVVDVAFNAHGLRVQRLYRRSINNTFHGIWSIGAVAGGLLGAAAAGLGLPLPAHLAISTVVLSALVLLGHRAMLPGPDDDPEQESESRNRSDTTPGKEVGHAVGLPLAALGALAACGAFIEDSGASWSALYLRTEADAGAATAGLGFVALMLAMTIGRLTGDRVVDRFGRHMTARVGGVFVAAGTGLTLTSPAVSTALIGFALVGLGGATLIPAVYHAADELPGLPSGRGLAVANWLLRIGFLLPPLLVGVLADLTSLRIALLTVVIAGCGIVLLARFLRLPVAPVGPDGVGQYRSDHSRATP